MGGGWDQEARHQVSGSELLGLLQEISRLLRGVHELRLLPIAGRSLPLARQAHHGGSDVYRGEQSRHEDTEVSVLLQAHINKSEEKRFADLGKQYRNPYNFGSRHNWHLFLGLAWC